MTFFNFWQRGCPMKTSWQTIPIWSGKIFLHVSNLPPKGNDTGMLGQHETAFRPELVTSVACRAGRYISGFTSRIAKRFSDRKQDGVRKRVAEAINLQLGLPF
jgi:hypothetical protein